MFNALESYGSSIEVVDILLTNGARTDVVDEVSYIMLYTQKNRGLLIVNFGILLMVYLCTSCMCA